MNWTPDRCRPGDMIRVDLGALYHYGIFVSEEQVIQFGLPPLPQNRRPQNEIAVLATPIDVFACGKIVEVARLDKEETARAFSPEQIVARASARLGETGYNLIHNNCEHFANECVFGQKRCAQEEEARRRWNNRPLLDVYLSPVDRSQPPEPVLCPARQAEIDACGNPALKQSKARDWQTLCFGLEKSLRRAPASLTFTQNKYGKWLCDGAYFSLSHAGDWVAAAVSTGPVGVDLECTAAFEARWAARPGELDALRRKAYTPAELRAARSETLVDFLKKWTRKEAVFKRDGTGKYHPRRIAADDAQTVTHLLPAPVDAVLSVCGAHSRYVRFYLWRDGEALQLLRPAEGGDGP